MPEAQSAPAAVSPAFPQGIEIFKPGRHTDMAGQVHEFSGADVRRMAAAYNPAQREAPLCVGHPEHNLPAYGYVRGLSVNAAGRLVMDTHQVAPRFAEWVKSGAYKKRSASFYPPDHPSNPAPGAWYLRHVGFLGAQPPAVAGLADIQFADGDEQGWVAFAESNDAGCPTPCCPTSRCPLLQSGEQACQPNPVTTQEDCSMTDTEKAELERQLQAAKDEAAAAQAKLAAAAAERDAAQAQAASFAEKAKAERLAAFTAFAEAQIKTGALLPKDKVLAVTALEALSATQPVAFAEGDTTRKVSLAGWLQELIAGTKPAVHFGEFAPRRALPGIAAPGGSDADIDRAAKQYAAQHKVSYADALTAVVSFDA